jgi:dTDP-4-amino-4,6-dideoxygalactose transaminase
VGPRRAAITDGRRVGVCYSFQAIKHLTTGDSGMLVVKKAADYARAKRLRWFDIDREAKKNRKSQTRDRRGIPSTRKCPDTSIKGMTSPHL